MKQQGNMCSRANANQSNHNAHPFKWTYTGEGLHEKVIRRFITWLQMESPQLTNKFLGKQVVLVSNLILKYWPKITTKTWLSLKNILDDKKDFLLNVIETDETHKSTLANLCNMLENNLEAY